MLNRQFLKKNKALIGAVSLLIVLAITAGLIKAPKKSKKGYQASVNSSSQQVTDNAAGDNTTESLNALTQKINESIASNKEIKKEYEKVHRKNMAILRNMKREVQESLTADLRNRKKDNKVQIAGLQQQLDKVNGKLKKMNQAKAEQSKGLTDYRIGGAGQGSSAEVVHLNGEKLIAVPDIAGRSSSTDQSSITLSSTNSNNNSSNGSILHPNGRSNSDSSSMINNTNNTDSNAHKKPKPIPYYTIPSGATLARSVTMTALIGRIPVNGVVKSPYPFKMIIGANNMAANGLHIPGISGAIIQGYTVGDMALSCVKGYITAMTFLFPNGTISTTKVHNGGNGNLGFNTSLGYISAPNGNPCFPGKFYTNAPTYLATMITLGALNKGGEAYSLAQQTAMSNTAGGTTTSLTGSVGKYMAGGAVQGGTQQAMDWFTEREKNSFDAVYVPAGKKAVINITQQIDINYNPTGRKIYYGETKNHHNNTSLD